MGVEIAYCERLGDFVGPVLVNELFFVFLGKAGYVVPVECSTQIDDDKPIDPIAGPGQDEVGEMIIENRVGTVWLEFLHD